jgi:hypothetical protein
MVSLENQAITDTSPVKDGRKINTKDLLCILTLIVYKLGTRSLPLSWFTSKVSICDNEDTIKFSLKSGD